MKIKIRISLQVYIIVDCHIRFYINSVGIGVCMIILNTLPSLFLVYEVS